MQVGLVTGKQRVELLEVPDPTAAPGRAVVDISYCGICGTDVHAYVSGRAYNPAICGHEWAGVVREVGSGVAHIVEGDRVAIGVATACGQCSQCRRGAPTHCEQSFAGAIGAGPMAAAHGGFAPAIAFDASRLYHVPQTLTDIEAGLLEPATVAVHALRRTPLQLGDSVIVIGAGPIGLLVLQAARISGAGCVVLIEPEPGRRALGAELGADLVLDPNAFTAAPDDPAPLMTAINQYLGHSGADVVFECAGVASTIQQAVGLVRRGGVVSLVGVAEHAASIDPGSWLVKEVRLVSSIAYLHEDFEICKALVADGRIKVAPLHTGTVSLQDLEQGFTRLAEHPADVKILVDPRM